MSASTIQDLKAATPHTSAYPTIRAFHTNQYYIPVTEVKSDQNGVYSVILVTPIDEGEPWVELSNNEVIMMDYIYLLVLAWMIQIVISTFSKTEQELKDRDQ